MSDRILIPVEPVPKPRMTRSDRWKVRPATTRYWKFKDSLNRLYDGEVPSAFDVTFHITMPKSWSNKKKIEMAGKPHQQRPDVDNILKSFLDALCEDDAYVYDVRVRKLWANTGGIELIIENEL